MKRRLVVLLSFALMLFAFAPAATAGHGNGAHTASLKGGNEVPEVDTNAQGQAIFKLSKDGSELHYKLIVANIENVTQAHIHLGPADANGGVVAFLYGFELIEGRTQGVLAQGTIMDADVIGALAGDLESLVAEMRAGNTYVNVHTIQNPGGEVRGQIR